MVEFLLGLASATLATIGAVKFAGELLDYVMQGEWWALPFLAFVVFFATFERYVWFVEQVLGRTVQPPRAIEHVLEMLPVDRYWRQIAVAYTLFVGALVGGLAYGMIGVIRDGELVEVLFFGVFLLSMVMFLLGLVMAFIVRPMVPAAMGDAVLEFLQSPGLGISILALVIASTASAIGVAGVDLLWYEDDTTGVSLLLLAVAGVFFWCLWTLLTGWRKGAFDKPVFKSAATPPRRRRAQSKPQRERT